MVSNCGAPSSRDAYVKELSKYIEIDIIGKCGKDICPVMDRKCIDNLQRTYKFYLSLENSYCKDYITEKTYKILKSPAVLPVVLGGGNYSSHLPLKSYLDVRDFKSSEHLAKQLHYLDSNTTAYRE